MAVKICASYEHHQTVTRSIVDRMKERAHALAKPSAFTLEWNMGLNHD